MRCDAMRREERKNRKRGRREKRVPEHWDGANWLVHCPLKPPSRYRPRSTEHIYVPTFQDDQLNGNGREISHQKQTFSHVSRSAGLTYGAASPENDSWDFFVRKQKKIERVIGQSWSRASRFNDSTSCEHRIRPGRIYG